MGLIDHPAKFHPDVLKSIDHFLGDAFKVLDPFAGVGGIHALRPERETWGIELEREWAAQSPYTIKGDSRWIPFDDATFDAIATSPAYGNRMADSYDGRDGSRRATYRIALGRPLSDGNGGGLQWGPEYRTLHAQVWREADRVLKPGGRFVLNCKNHIRNGEEQLVTQWHVEFIESRGYQIRGSEQVDVTGNPWLGNGTRLDHEWVFLLRKPDAG